MRSNQQNKRSRGRNNNHNRKNTNPLTRSYESNGPDVRVRGNAAHVAEKYVQLARDANSSGDSVMAENYLQHAEHYFRIISAVQSQQQAQQQFQVARAGQQREKPQENQAESNDEARTDVSANADSAGTGDEESIAVSAREGDWEENIDAGTRNNQGDGGRGQQKSQRMRRPRRRPIAEKPEVEKSRSGIGKASIGLSGIAEDPANAPQPEVGELPAFVTEDADSPAAE